VRFDSEPHGYGKHSTRTSKQEVSMPDTTRPTPTTRDAERAEAEVHAQPDRMPTDDEEAKADENELDPEVAEHEREMLERGANQQGEGRLP